MISGTLIESIVVVGALIRRALQRCLIWILIFCESELGHNQSEPFVGRKVKTLLIPLNGLKFITQVLRASRIRQGEVCLKPSIKAIDLIFVWFYGISTNEGYLMPNPLYTYILNIYDLFYGISTSVCFLMPNPLYTYILNIYDLV